jgi:hypothetical protein
MGTNIRAVLEQAFHKQDWAPIAHVIEALKAVESLFRDNHPEQPDVQVACAQSTKECTCSGGPGKTSGNCQVKMCGHAVEELPICTSTAPNIFGVTMTLVSDPADDKIRAENEARSQRTNKEKRPAPKKYSVTCTTCGLAFDVPEKPPADLGSYCSTCVRKAKTNRVA